MKLLTTKFNGLLPRRARAAGGPRLELLLPRAESQTTAPSDPIMWRQCSRAGEWQSGRGTLENLPPAESAAVYIWTPATETLLTRASLPTRSRAKVAQALPYALEEQLLEDPAKLHFAWRREDDGSLSVAVTAKETLRAWQATLLGAGLKPVAICPATLAVPWSPACWSVAFLGDEILVRSGPAGGFSCAQSVAEPPAVMLGNFKQAQQEGRTPEYIIVFQPPADFRADAWTAAFGVPVRIEAQSFWDTPGDSEPALNLLQGEFALVGELRQRLRPWLPAAVMLALWLVATIAFDTAEWFGLYRRHSENTREMSAILQAAFPETKTILDPARQMQQGLEKLQGRSGMRAHDLLPLLGQAARAWQTEPRARLRGLRYSDRSLTLEILAPDTQVVESVQRALQTRGLQSELLTSAPRANETEARLRIQAAATSAKP